MRCSRLAPRIAFDEESGVGVLFGGRGLDDLRLALGCRGGAVHEGVVGALGEDHVVGGEHVVGVELVDSHDVHLRRVAQREPGRRVGALEHHEELDAVGDRRQLGQGGPGGYGQQPWGAQQGDGSGGGNGKTIGLVIAGVLVLVLVAVGGFFGVRALTGDDDKKADGGDDPTSESTEGSGPTDETSSSGDVPTNDVEPTAPS